MLGARDYEELVRCCHRDFLLTSPFHRVLGKHPHNRGNQYRRKILVLPDGAATAHTLMLKQQYPPACVYGEHTWHPGVLNE